MFRLRGRMLGMFRIKDFVGILSDGLGFPWIGVSLGSDAKN